MCSTDQKKPKNLKRSYLELLLTGQLDSKDDVQVFVAGSVVSDKHVAGCGAVQADITDRDALPLQPGPHGDDDVTRTQLQRGKVPAAVDWDHLRQNLMKDLHLLSVQAVKPLAGFPFRHAAVLKRKRGRRRKRGGRIVLLQLHFLFDKQARLI